MSKSRYVSNSAGLEEVARGQVAQGLVRTHTEAKRNAAGDGFETSYRQGTFRFRGIVYPGTYSARKRNARDNTLVRVIG